MDDLIKTGGTIIECAKVTLQYGHCIYLALPYGKLFIPNHKNHSLYIFQALRKAGANKISAYVTHGVFPQDSWKRFTTADLPFDNFFITDSLPYATHIATHKPFQLLSLTEAISEALLGFDLVQR